MIDKTEIDTFISQNTKEKKENIFQKHKEIIFYMREQNIPFKTILKFLISKDDEIKSRYSSAKKFPTGVSFLSASVKRFEKKDTPKKNSKTTPNEPKKVAQNEPKKEKVTLDNFNDYQPPVSNKYEKDKK